jgi:hypothetical protein
MLRDVTGEEQSLTFSADLPALCLSMCVRMYVYVNDEFLVFGHQFVSNIHKSATHWIRECIVVCVNEFTSIRKTIMVKEPIRIETIIMDTAYNAYQSS